MFHVCRMVLAATLLAGIGNAPALADGQRRTDKPKSVGELISDCMKDIERGKTTGRKLSQQQRMVAEAQCRARAEAQAASRNG